jgi:hypothetical protein
MTTIYVNLFSIANSINFETYLAFCIPSVCPIVVAGNLLLKTFTWPCSHIFCGTFFSDVAAGVTSVVLFQKVEIFFGALPRERGQYEAEINKESYSAGLFIVVNEAVHDLEAAFKCAVHPNHYSKLLESTQSVDEWRIAR